MLYFVLFFEHRVIGINSKLISATYKLSELGQIILSDFQFLHLYDGYNKYKEPKFLI